MGSESDRNQIGCLGMQCDKILWISDSEAEVKVEKTGGFADGEGRCGEDGRFVSKGQAKFKYFIGEERSKAVSK